MTLEIALLAVPLAALLGLGAISLAITAHINRRHPPEGELRTILGGRMHIAERCPTGCAPRADLVLIHGASASLGDQLVALSDTLARRYRVLAVDRPGQGWSERPAGMGDASPTRQALRIAEVLRQIGVGRAVVIGHSFGAAVAAALAIERPSLVQGLVLVAAVSHPWPGGVAWHYRLAALPLLGPLFSFLLAPIIGSLILERSAEAAFRPQSPPPDYAGKAGAARAVTPKRFRANGQDVARLKQHVEKLSRRYHEIKAPCVIITGDADTTVWPSIHSQGLARDIEGSRLVVLEGVGHMPHHARPDAVLAAVEEILAAGQPTDGRSSQPAEPPCVPKASRAPSSFQASAEMAPEREEALRTRSSEPSVTRQISTQPSS
jgi:pimeloyl-ACP methyl ester carboxylesterase